MNNPGVWGISFHLLSEKQGVGGDPFPLALHLQVLVTPRGLLHGVAEI